MSASRRLACVVAIVAIALCAVAAGRAQTPSSVQNQASYVVGPQDVLVITSYDQPELTGKFTIEIDGTFSYPLVGRVRVAGMTLRDVEELLKKTLVDRGFFIDPQVTVAIETYRSQRIYVVGEVRTPGAYPLSGDMRLVEALALAGSTTPTASGEAVIVRANNESVVVDPSQIAAAAAKDTDGVVRVDLRELENGDLSQNVPLRSGDTIFVLRAESVYVFGQVKSPGAYPLRQRNTTVLQALSLAGGVTDRGAVGRVQIIRIVDGKKQELRAELTDFILPRDTIIVPERFF
jgi:polysaccharide export outer membrane protein